MFCHASLWIESLALPLIHALQWSNACANPDLLGGGGGGGCNWTHAGYIRTCMVCMVTVYIHILCYTLVYCISYCLIEAPISLTRNYIIGASLNSLHSKLYQSGQLVTMVMQYIVCT